MCRTPSGRSSNGDRGLSPGYGSGLQVEGILAQREEVFAAGPVQPTLPGMPERRTHDYLQHGTTSLLVGNRCSFVTFAHLVSTTATNTQGQTKSARGAGVIYLDLSHL